MRQTPAFASRRGGPDASGAEGVAEGGRTRVGRVRGGGSLVGAIAGVRRCAAGRLYFLDRVGIGETAMTSTAVLLGPTVTGGTAGKTNPGLVTVSA